MSTATVAAVGITTGRRRTLRDTLLMAAAATLAGSGLLVLISRLLSLVDELQNGYLAGLKVASGMDLLAGALQLAAYALAIAAFATVASSRRASLLALALALYAGGALASFVSDLLSAIEYGTNSARGTYVAGYAVSCAGDIVLGVAAVIAALAFGLAAAAPGRRDGRLGWASVVLAGALTFKFTSMILVLSALSGSYIAGGVTNGLGVGIGGVVVQVAGTVVAAVALLLAGGRQRGGAEWLSAREGLLGVAAAVLALGFLLSGIGEMLYAGGVSSLGSGGERVAAAWLGAVGELIILGASACAAVGFLLSRRAVRGVVTTQRVTSPTSAGDQRTRAFCSQCGEPRTPNSRFCSSCGSSFSEMGP
jgi:hypothetical protein